MVDRDLIGPGHGLLDFRIVGISEEKPPVSGRVSRNGRPTHKFVICLDTPQY